MKHRHRVILALLVIAAVSCASVGTGDPLVVRTEDVLSNSLTIYDHAMAYHYAHSTSESPKTYATFERMRVGFPTAWRGVFNALQTYKANKTTTNANQLNALLLALQTLVTDVQPLIPGGA